MGHRFPGGGVVKEAERDFKQHHTDSDCGEASGEVAILGILEPADGMLHELLRYINYRNMSQCTSLARSSR
jgi:hypothetical protein